MKNWRNTTGDPILDAAIRNAHPEIISDKLSVNDLCNPPRKVLLERRNETAPATADHVQGLIQSAFQKSLGLPLEEVEHNGQAITGRFIVQDEVLTVYKHPSTHARTRYFKALEEQPNKTWDSYHPWILELNLAAHLARLLGIKFDRLEIRAIYTDWRRALAERDPHDGGLREGPAGYPQTDTEALAVEMLPREQAKDFFNHRVNLFTFCNKKTDDQLPLCTARERWETPEKWEVWADGGQRSSYTAETEREALNRIDRMTTGKQYEARHVPPVPVRCLHHCMAAPFCNQYLERKS